MLHGIASYEGPCSSQASFAVNSDGSFGGLGQIDEFMDNFQRRHTSISKVELLMFNTIFCEILRVVGLIVESDHSGDSQFLKDGDVVMGCEGAILHTDRLTPYLSVVFSEGELKAMNLFGRIQFKSPFYIFS